MDVVAILRTTRNNQTFRKCFLTRPDFLRLAHDVGNDGFGNDSFGSETGTMKIPYSPPQAKSPPDVLGSSGSVLSQHDSAYSSSNGLDMLEYLSVDNRLQTDNRDNEYDDHGETKKGGFSNTEDILLHINEDVIRSCQKYVDEVQACVSLNQQTQKQVKRRRRPRKLPQIPLSPASTVKTTPLQTQSPINSVSLAEELHGAGITFHPGPDDDPQYPRPRNVYIPATLNSLGSPEDIDPLEPDAGCSNGFSRSQEPSVKQKLCPTADSDDDRLTQRTMLREQTMVEYPEKTLFVGATNVRLHGQYLGDQPSSPTRCDRLVSSAPEPLYMQETSKRDSVVSVTCSTVNVDDLEVTHRGCHKFIPRHSDEIFIQIGDPIYVEAEHEDLWCEGINLRSKQQGIFPAVCATDLSFFESQEAGAGPSSTRYCVKYLGSVEVKHHKGTDVLCQAIHKVALSRRSSSKKIPLCCLELNDYGITMRDRSQLQKDTPSSLDSITQRLAKLLSKERGIGEGVKHFFSFKNVSFCGCHPHNDSYFAFITKHPLEMKFACHVFLGEGSTKCIADTLGKAFRSYYQQYMAFSHPTEDIYLE